MTITADSLHKGKKHEEMTSEVAWGNLGDVFTATINGILLNCFSHLLKWLHHSLIYVAEGFSSWDADTSRPSLHSVKRPPLWYVGEVNLAGETDKAQAVCCSVMSADKLMTQALISKSPGKLIDLVNTSIDGMFIICHLLKHWIQMLHEKWCMLDNGREVKAQISLV